MNSQKLASSLIVGFVLGLPLGVGACSLFTKENAKTVLDIAKVVCIVANAESDDATVQGICGVIGREVPAMEQLLGEHRRKVASAKAYGFARASSVPCVADAGPLADAGAFDAAR